MHRVSLAVTTTAALVLMAIGGTRLYVDHSLDVVQNTALSSVPGVAKVSGKGALAAKPAAGQPFTVLILGVDSRAGTGTEYGTDADACNCSDTIMLARVNPQTTKVSLLSIPRDTRVELTGYNRVTKINAAYGKGADNTVATIEKSLNIPINHWIVLDLAGFKSIVDAIGGVRMDIPVPIRDRNAGLDLETTGCQVVSGNEALAISRSRELQYLSSGGTWTDDPTYEYGRARREQAMMRLIAAHTVKSSLGNPLTAAKVIKTFTGGNRLAVDNQVTSSELIDLAGDFAGFDAASMQTYTLPTVTEKIYDSGAGKKLDFEVLQPTKDTATIQAWYAAVQPAVPASSAATPTQPAAVTTTAPAAPTTSTGAPTVSRTTAAAPTAAVTTSAAVAPNQPQPWDPRPCS
jgi:LCP family protein required for cell wall assembly